MPLFNVDMKVCATAYIRAKDEKEAMRIARGLKYSQPIIQDSGGDVDVYGGSFATSPNVSLSPAMTIHGPWRGARPDVAE